MGSNGFVNRRSGVQSALPAQRKKLNRYGKFSYRPVIERHARAFRAALKALKAVRA